MTIINNTSSNQIVITKALARLSGALDRSQKTPYDTVKSELEPLFTGSVEESNVVVDNLSKAGDTPRVSVELYNPSTNIFDETFSKIKLSNQPIREDANQTYTFTSGPHDCVARFLVVNNGNVKAEIKNYHHILVVDYTCTSLLYSNIIVDSMKTTLSSFSAKLSEAPRFGDNYQSSGFITAISYPTTVVYRTTSAGYDNIRVTGMISGISYPNEVGYRTASAGYDNIRVTGMISGISYPTIVAYITYDILPDSYTSSAKIYSISYV